MKVVQEKCLCAGVPFINLLDRQTVLVKNLTDNQLLIKMR